MGATKDPGNSKVLEERAELFEKSGTVGENIAGDKVGGGISRWGVFRGKPLEGKGKSGGKRGGGVTKGSICIRSGGGRRIEGDKNSKYSLGGGALSYPLG